jgi:anti-sigma-K factor RskA
MTHEELQDQYELYAIGVAGEPERNEIRDHLARGCEVCMKEMNRARQLTALLGASAAPAEPSRKLRRRILASVGFEQRGFGWSPWLAGLATLAIVAAVYFGGREREFAEDATRLRQQVRRQTIELTRLTEAFAILSGPSTTEASFGQGPKGKVYVDPQRGVLLIASNLPPAPAGKIYEMWVIPKGGKPVPAGLFQSEPTGAAIHVQPGPVVADAAAVAVTVEPEAGSPQPTTTPFMVATLQ